MNFNTITMPEEESIDLVDLFFFLAKKWRGILLAVLIGAVLGGGLFFVQRSRMNKAAADPSFQTALQNYELQRSALSERLNACQRAYDTLNGYLSNSVLMSVDPNNVPTAKAVLHIDLVDDDNPSVVDELIAAYSAAAETAIDWACFPQVETPYKDELVVLQKDFPGRSVIVSVVYSDWETASALADGIAQQIIGSAVNYQNIAPHTIAVRSQTTTFENDPDLLETRRTAYKTLNDYRDNISIAYSNFVGLSAPSLPGTNAKKLAAVVCIGCVFCYAAFLAAAYLLSGAVHTEEDIADAYGISLIGKFYPDQKKAWLDRLLNKWQYGRVFESDEAVCSRIVSNVRNLNKGGKILLTGGTSDASLNVLAEKLRAQLPETEFETGADVARDSTTLAKMNQADAIVLVEQAGVSRRAAVRQEILSIAGISKPILGVVFLSEGKQLS